MLLLVGEVRDVTTVPRVSARGNPYDETTIFVLTRRAVVRVRKAPGDHFRGDVPAVGERVALEVSVDCYVRKQVAADGSAAAAYSLTAWGCAPADVAEAAFEAPTLSQTTV